jgi:hypothetical protein
MNNRKTQKDYTRAEIELMRISQKSPIKQKSAYTALELDLIAENRELRRIIYEIAQITNIS